MKRGTVFCPVVFFLMSYGQVRAVEQNAEVIIEESRPAEESSEKEKPVSRRRVKRDSKNEWETFFMPGIQYGHYIPKDSTKYGSFNGFSVEFLIAAWVRKNDRRGPSHGRIFFDIGLMNSDKSQVREGLLYGLGIDLSLERNPRRDYLIPYFGLKYGGFNQGLAGHINHFTPLAGLHIYSSRNLFVNLSLGYVYPLEKLEELRGWQGSFAVDFSLW